MGVVQEALFTAGVDPAHHVAVTVRAAYKAKSNFALDAMIASTPVLHATPKNRLEAVLSAVALLPD